MKAKILGVALIYAVLILPQSVKAQDPVAYSPLEIKGSDPSAPANAPSLVEVQFTSDGILMATQVSISHLYKMPSPKGSVVINGRARPASLLWVFTNRRSTEVDISSILDPSFSWSGDRPPGTHATMNEGSRFSLSAETDDGSDWHALKLNQ